LKSKNRQWVSEEGGEDKRYLSESGNNIPLLCLVASLDSIQENASFVKLE
jgi:hypothetical protein